MYQVSRWSAISTQTVLVAWSVIVIFPMLWMVYSSFKTDQELFFSPWSPPAELQWDNFERAWNKAHVGEYLLNTLIVVIPALLLTLILSAMAAYVLHVFVLWAIGSFSIYFFPACFSPYSLHWFLSFPCEPIRNAQHISWVDTGLCGLFSSLHNFLPHRIFQDLPTELEESAIIDGANPFQVF